MRAAANKANLVLFLNFESNGINADPRLAPRACARALASSEWKGLHTCAQIETRVRFITEGHWQSWAYHGIFSCSTWTHEVRYVQRHQTQPGGGKLEPKLQGTDLAA